MIASSAGRNRSFWRSSRGLATASPNADDPPPHRTIRPKRESQIARNPALLPPFPAKSITSLAAFRSPLTLSRVHWVRPELVAEVKFLSWTEDDLLRQVVYEGLREDEPAAEVRRAP